MHLALHILNEDGGVIGCSDVYGSRNRLQSLVPIKLSEAASSHLLVERDTITGHPAVR